MTKFLLAFVVAALALGCGGEGGESPLVGVWAYAPTEDYAYALQLGADDKFETARIKVSGSSLNTERTFGTYSHDADSLHLTIRESTCAGRATMTSAGYHFAGQNLVLEFADGALSMFPVTGGPDTSGGAYVYGCFSSVDGSFTPGPIRAVP